MARAIVGSDDGLVNVNVYGDAMVQGIVKDSSFSPDGASYSVQIRVEQGHHYVLVRLTKEEIARLAVDLLYSRPIEIEWKDS